MIISIHRLYFCPLSLTSKESTWLCQKLIKLLLLKNLCLPIGDPTELRFPKELLRNIQKISKKFMRFQAFNHEEIRFF